MVRQNTVMVLAALVAISTLTRPHRAGANDQVIFNAPEIQVSSASETSPKAESELQQGIALSQQGRFSEAIPYFLGAKGHVLDEYAENFNLALCYVGTNEFNQAIQLLTALKISGHATAAVNNLLAQAYIGAGQDKEAFSAFQQAVKQTPRDEQLYLFVADACMDHQSYDLGLHVLNIGLQHLPQSARLHYERGVFLSFENEVDPARADFRLASKLDPGSGISYMAEAQKALLEGDIPEAARISHEGIQKGHENYVLLTIFGNSVIHSDIRPDQHEFSEARAALEKSVTERPNYALSQAALGELYLMTDRVDKAIKHLEVARKLAPDDESVYSHLAIAYRRKNNGEKAKRMLAILATLNQRKAAAYKSASPGHKAGYLSSRPSPRRPAGGHS